MRHVFRRAPHPFPPRSPAAPPEGLPARFVLQLLPSADQSRRQKGTDRAPREFDGQRNEFFPHPPAARFIPESRPRGNPEAKTGAPRLVAAHLERRLLDRPGALHARDYGLRCAGLLLPAQSAPFRHADAQAPDPAAVESGDHCFGHQLFRAAHGSAGCVQRKSNGYGGLHHAPALFRQSRRQVRHQAGAEKPGAIRFSQSENRISAAAQRRHFLPQRDDLFRRSRTKAPD